MSSKVPSSFYLVVCKPSLLNIPQAKALPGPDFVGIDGKSWPKSEEIWGLASRFQSLEPQFPHLEERNFSVMCSIRPVGSSREGSGSVSFLYKNSFRMSLILYGMYSFITCYHDGSTPVTDLIFPNLSSLYTKEEGGPFASKACGHYFPNQGEQKNL